jgi:hypothetical protein
MAKTDRKRKSKGCFDFTSKEYVLENILYKTCIANFNTPIDFLTEAFSLYEKGVLPFKGTLGEQPNRIIEIFNLIESRRNSHLEQEAKNG